MSNLRGARRRSELVCGADIGNAVHLMRSPGLLLAFFALLHVLAPEVGYTRKAIGRRRLVPVSLLCPVPTTLPLGSSWAVFFCPIATDHCMLAGNADSLLFVCRDHSSPPLLGSKHGMGSVGFRWSCAHNSGFLTPGADDT